MHDVKTEVYGTKAVRYKAEIQFNAEAITRRCRGLGRIPSPEAEALAMELKALSANPDPIEVCHEGPGVRAPRPRGSF